MAIEGPGAIDDALACEPKHSGGWRSGGFLASRGMRVAQGKKVARPPLRHRRSRRSRPSVRSGHQEARGTRASGTAPGTRPPRTNGLQLPARPPAPPCRSQAVPPRPPRERIITHSLPPTIYNGSTSAAPPWSAQSRGRRTAGSTPSAAQPVRPSASTTLGQAICSLRRAGRRAVSAKVVGRALPSWNKANAVSRANATDPMTKPPTMENAFCQPSPGTQRLTISSVE